MHLVGERSPDAGGHDRDRWQYLRPVVYRLGEHGDWLRVGSRIERTHLEFVTGALLLDRTVDEHFDAFAACDETPDILIDVALSELRGDRARVAAFENGYVRRAFQGDGQCLLDGTAEDRIARSVVEVGNQH